MNGIKTLTAGQTIKVPNATNMSLSRGTASTGIKNPVTFAPVTQRPTIASLISGQFQNQGMQGQGAVGGSLQGIPLAPGSNSVTNSLVTGGYKPPNPQLQPGGYGYTAQNIANRPNTQLPQSMLPYYDLASNNFAAGASSNTGTAGVSGPWNGDGVYNSQDINWRRGTAGYGQDFTRGRNRDLRNIRTGSGGSAASAAPQIVNANPYLNNVLTWRIAT